MLPPPTDDELLLAFVDDCPSQAVQDYRRRTGTDWVIGSADILDHMEREWKRRVNQP
jgi:hypothetical protein